MRNYNFTGTTILSVRKGDKVAIAGDGQITLGTTILKGNANKIRTLKGGKYLIGFAGSTADAITLFERFEQKLNKYPGNFLKAAVELAKEWRTDKVLRRLQALMLAVGKEATLLISGNGDVIESEDGVLGIGSGAPYAVAAAKALLKNTKLTPVKIVEEAMKIAAEICIYTNTNFKIAELKS